LTELGRLVVSLVGSVLLVGTACAPAPPAHPFDGRGDIIFVDGPDTSLDRQIARLVDKWNATRGYDQEVRFVEMPPATDNYRAQLRTRAQELANVDPDEYPRQCYDVVTMDVIWTAEFARAGYLVPLDPAEFHVDELLRRPVDAVTIDGKLWAVPMRTDVGLLYYRKDLVEAPRTWAELIESARRVGPANDMDGYVGQFDRYEGLTVNALEAIWAHGGEVLTPEGDVVVDSPEALAGIEMLANGIEEGWISRTALGFGEEQSREAFQQGRAVFLRNWPYVYAQLNGPASPVADKFGVAPLPGPGALGGWNLGVSTCSKNRETARDFIEFVVSEENQRLLFEKAGFAPTNASLYDDPGLRRQFKYLDVLRDGVENSRYRPSTPFYEDVSDTIQEYVANAMSNPVSAGEMTDRLADRLTTVAQGR
jgi:multiple sugar transport system substrate-binding protein